MSNQNPCRGNEDAQQKPTSWPQSGAVFDPFGLPAAAEDIGAHAEFSLDGDEKYRSVDILPVPSLRRPHYDQLVAPSATMGMPWGGINKPALSSSINPAKPYTPQQVPEVVVVNPPPPPITTTLPLEADTSSQHHLEAPRLPLHISVFPLEKCHYFTEKEPEVSITFIIFLRSLFFYFEGGMGVFL